MKKLIPGLLLGGLLLFLLLRRVDPALVAEALLGANARLFAAALGFKAVVVWIKARRWAVAIEGGAGVRPRRRVVSAMLIGFAGNLVLPARLGEVARAAVLRKHNDVPKGLSLTSVAVTQLFDLAALGCLLAAFVLWGTEGQASLVDVRALGLLLGLLILAAAALVLLARHELALHDFLSRWTPAVLWRHLGPLVSSFSTAIRVVRAPSHLAAILLYTLLIWALEVAAIACALAAFEVPVTAAMAVVTMAALNLSLAIPVTPGNLGTHQLVSVLVLDLFGVPEARALAFSIGLQGVVLTTIFALGTLLFYREGLSLRSLDRAAGNPEE